MELEEGVNALANEDQSAAPLLQEGHAAVQRAVENGKVPSDQADEEKWCCIEPVIINFLHFLANMIVLLRVMDKVKVNDLFPKRPTDITQIYEQTAQEIVNEGEIPQGTAFAFLFLTVSFFIF